MKVFSFRTKTLLTLLLAFATGLAPTFAWAGPIDDAKRDAQNLSKAFEHVASQVTPALVNIRATAKLRKTSGRQQIPQNIPAPFRDLFEQFNVPHGFGQGAPRQPRSGFGSGVIVDAKGHILTNNHVIEGADEVNVQLSDGRSVEAEIIGTDPRTDLAVIKIDADNLSPARLGDSDKLSIGEWVVAAGAPFGLENTITAGIVSAKGRSIMGSDSYEDFIQTDAAINPGNSGGPLANLDGEVIGINTAIFSRSGGYMGIGFAIPVNMAKSVMQSLISDGKVTRGWLGVVIQQLNEELAKSFNYPSEKGALVAEVGEDSPAEDAGVQQGDIVIAFNGKEINEVNDLRNHVAAEKPGSRADLTVIREGRKKTITVKLGELPSKGDEMRDEPEEEELMSEIGLQLKTLTSEMAERMKARAKRGVLVEAVAPESTAARSGIQPGDIIHSVGPKKVESVNDFEELVDEDAIEDGVRLIVESRGMDRFIILKDR